jgi:SAM-dependent methyltransferase
MRTVVEDDGIRISGCLWDYYIEGLPMWIGSKTNIPEIDKIIKKIYKINKKSAYIVYKYFFNMEKNLQECNKVLKKDGHYILVVGNNWVRGIEIPIHRGLLHIAKRNGFKLEEIGYDLITNRKFMTKRNNTVPIIEKDWVIDLHKT